MNLLTPGTGNQSANRERAIEYIAEHIIEADSIDLEAGNITANDGTSYHVSAYAETPSALISTPGKDRSEHSIYASGLRTLMFRQLKNDKRSFIYDVDPKMIPVKPNSRSAQWPDIDKAASRIWVCTADRIRLIDRR